MAWICGKEGAQYADGVKCACANGSVGKAWSAAEIAAQKADFEAVNGAGSWDYTDPVTGKQSPKVKP